MYQVYQHLLEQLTNGDLDVDGHTELDNVNVSGVHPGAIKW